MCADLITPEEYKEQLVAAFERQFGHLDFWRLSKRWKMIRYKQFIDMLYAEMEFYIQERNKTNGSS